MLTRIRVEMQQSRFGQVLMVGAMILAGLLLLHLWPFSRPAALIPMGWGDVPGQPPPRDGAGAGPDRRGGGEGGIRAGARQAATRPVAARPQITPPPAPAGPAFDQEDGELSVV